MPTILLMRHGKSDWSSGGRDHERPLNERGVRHARLMGGVLATIGEVPDLVVTSSAVRAQSTAELAMAGGSFEGASFDVRESLYLPSVDDVLDAITSIPPGVERAMIVGHQPTWGYATEALCGARVDFVTAAMAAIEMRSFGDPRGGTMRWFLPPRRAEELLG